MTAEQLRSAAKFMFATAEDIAKKTGRSRDLVWSCMCGRRRIQPDFAAAIGEMLAEAAKPRSIPDDLMFLVDKEA